jgi:hypothetical protein
MKIFVRAKVDKKFRIPVGRAAKDGKSVRSYVEVLTTGQQAVVPPSVHPDTKRPYEWIAGPDGRVLSLYEMRVEGVPVFEGDLCAALVKGLLPQPLIEAYDDPQTRRYRNNALNREVFFLPGGGGYQ